MDVPISMLRDDEWFKIIWAGNRHDPRPQEMAVGRVLRSNECSVKVWFTRRWGKPAKESGEVSPATMVTRAVEPTDDIPPDAAQARGPDAAFDIFDEVL